MDDLFQYLIYGIIIFSFLSSLFKKKEQPKPPLPKSAPKTGVQFPKEQESMELSKATQKADEYDILKEIENLFKDQVKVPQQQKTNSSVPREYYDHEISDKDLELENDIRIQREVESNIPIEYRTSVEERNYIEPKGTIEKKRSVEDRITTRTKTKPDKKIDAQAEQFEKVLSGLQKKSVFHSEFRKKIKNPLTVREFILFSEILGKPKALRR